MSYNEIALHSPPTDGVTACRFSPDSSHLIVSSWDCSLSLHSTATGERSRAPEALPQPLLDCDFVRDGPSMQHAVSACLDGGIRFHNLTSGDSSATTLLGSHDSAARCVRACPAVGGSCVVSGSWDHTLKLWDARAATPCVGTYEQPDKVLALDVSSAAASATPILAVATAARRVVLVDLRSPAEPMQTRESSLKCATRCIAMMPSASGFTLGSVEGRVAVEYVDPSPEAQARRYAFKCHRTTAQGVDTPHPVNAIAFHPTYGTFATGGGDGNVFVWDGAKKKRIGSLKRRYPTSIACLAFSPSGEQLAVAASYTYENGEQKAPPDAIYLQKVSDSPATFKPKAEKAK